ncbi:GFA family protein [Rhodobacteraceae bacterium]|nr:GFA family protein [Paracoccaceae bacterium]
MLTGTCHCGQVTWTFDANPKSVTACNCTNCAKAGVLWIYGTEGEDITVTGPTTPYVRKDGGALEFHHCQTCGNNVFWRLTDPDNMRAAVNLRLTDDPKSLMDLPVRHFDGLNAFEALPDDDTTLKDLWF